MEEFLMIFPNRRVNIRTDALRSSANLPLIGNKLISPNNKEWMDIVMDEVDSTRRNKVWELVDRPSRSKFIRNKWVFQIQHREDGLINKFRGRLVAKGFMQIKNIDYEGSFFSVLRFASIRLLLAWLPIWTKICCKLM